MNINNLSGRFQFQRPAFLFFTLFAFALNTGAAQQANSDSAAVVDTARKAFLPRVMDVAGKAAQKSVEDYEKGKIEIRQDETIDLILKTTAKVKPYLKSGIDTVVIQKQLNELSGHFEIVEDGVFLNKGTSQTYRNLTTSYVILSELIRKAKTIKSGVDKYQHNLAAFKNQLDSLNSEPALYALPNDSEGIVRYIERLQIVSFTISPVDSALKAALSGVKEVQKSVNKVVNEFNFAIEEIDGYQKSLSNKTFDREFNNLWDPIGFSRPFTEILQFSKAKGWLALRFYAGNHTGKLCILILLILVSTVFLRSLRKKLKRESLLNKDMNGQLVIRNTILSSLVIVPNLFQFIFPNPPFVFNALLWSVSAVSLTFLFRGFISRYWMYSWIALVALFLMACADNAILQASRVERWIMVALALLGIFTCLFILMKGHRNELREKSIVYFIGLVVLLELFSMWANAFGRYNFAKTILTTGYISVIIAILFLWTVRLINEALELASLVYKKPDRQLFFINFNRVGRKVPPVFYVFLITGWFILFGRNFYSFNLITDPLVDFLVKERALGDYTFSIISLFIFFFIIILSAVVSRIVSFFASDSAPASHTDQSNKGGLGSWLLIVRIMILSIGLFLAFAAAGIPLDKLSIIIGALGVGIGFGLNTLINNLVSGLIISFEKPVNVGDIVEIGSHSGTMKSIGFRSSIVSTWEGADIIVPNGDLLNEHLKNWTLSNGRRRVDIVVGVAYGTDLGKAKKLLLELLGMDERIMKHPEPGVLLIGFNNSSIDLKVMFWVRHFMEYTGVKSDVILAIDELFKKNKIVIPFPQQDIYLHEIASDRQPEEKPEH